MAQAPAILGLGLASPAHSATQSQALGLGLSVTLEDPTQAALVAGLYARSGVDHRASVVVNSSRAEGEQLDQSLFPVSDHSDWPTTAQRMKVFELPAAALAVRAARSALEESGLGASDITDLLTVSCTGLGSPGVDVALMNELALSPGVRRVNIGFMGCHGAIVALRTSAALAASGDASDRRPNRVLAVCVELCSLHLQRTARVDRHVSNALFADGCAALVIGTAEMRRSARDGTAQHGASQRGSTNTKVRLRILDSTSRLFPDSASAMTWHIGNAGFEMTLDRGVPALLEHHLGDWVWPWLRSCLGNATGPDDVRWAIHPGGPRVLDAAARALALTAEQVFESREVLRNHGNMSSPTVLYIVDRLLTRQPDGRPIVMLAFGPGLTGEAALIQPISDTGE